MRTTTLALAATALVLSGSFAQAGGLAEEIMEAPVIAEEPMVEPAGSSISPTIIVVGILAALLLVASQGDDDGSDDAAVEMIEASDIRLKEDITQVGTAFNGLPIYTFSYIGQEGTYLGVMAQDVLMHTPDAVSVKDDGYMAVNYGMLGMGMVKLN